MPQHAKPTPHVLMLSMLLILLVKLPALNAQPMEPPDVLL